MTRHKLTLRLDDADWRALHVAALDESSSVQAILVRLVRRWLAERA